jgi:hypothetical protein
MNQDAIDAYNLKQQEARERQQELDTTIEVGDKVKGAVEFQTAKLIANDRTSVRKVDIQNNLATPQDIAKVVNALDRLQTELKPESVEFQPVIEALASLGSKLDVLPKSFPEVPEAPESVKIQNLDEFKKYLQPVLDGINSLELSPIFDPRIEVKPADVKLTTEKVDLTRLENILKSQGEVEKIEFSDFHAQDIDNASETLQYVGLETLDGRWCFIENDIESNSMRFFFGKGNYLKEWSNHISRPYRILSRAYNAV